ncbi:MAG: hypothetical protein EOP06_08275 [Proteobacteria bacterium]|nr:MAG: hypothetical protein EOP06_08275 [Pseudomonadota bacterium]
MSAPTIEETLYDYVIQGIVKELFIADEAKALCAEIGNHAEKVNSQGLGELFGSLQAAYSERQTLSIAKLFDPPSNKYPTRSIPAVIDFMERNVSALPVTQTHVLHKRLVFAGHDELKVKSLSNEQLAREVCADLQSTLPKGKQGNTDPLSVALLKVKESRDKAIAHNEAVHPSARQWTTWGEEELLVDYAKDFVALVSFGFLGLYLGDGANWYYNSASASRTSKMLSRVLQLANLAA